MNKEDSSINSSFLKDFLDNTPMRVFFELSEQEDRVAQMIASGLEAKEVAQMRCKAVTTIRNQMQSIYEKLGVRNRSELSVKMMEKIFKILPASIDNVSIESEKLFEKSNESESQIIDSEEAYKEAVAQGLKLLPEVNFKFSAGQVSLLNGTEDITRYWYLPDCKDCEGVAQVVGNSMSPALPSGCWVALKKYTMPRGNPNTIPFGNIFGIVLEDEDTGDFHGHIKILRRYKDQELSRKYWIAHSINSDEFDDFDIEIAQIRSLWIIKQHIVSDILL